MKPVIVMDLIHIFKDRQSEQSADATWKMHLSKTFFFSFQKIPSTTHIQTHTTLFILPFKYLSVWIKHVILYFYQSVCIKKISAH